MNNNWEFDYSELYNNNTGANAQNAAAPETAAPAQGTPGPAGMYGAGMGGAPVPPYMPPQKKRGWGKRIAAGAAAVVFCGAVGFGGGYLGYTFAKGDSAGPVIYQAPAASSGTGSADNGTVSTADALSVTEIASKVGPSVVEVTTEAVTTNTIFGEYVQSGAGSGVIITEDGYIITNNHVVSGASQVTVRLSDGTEYAAAVVGTDSKTDIAVLKIEATGLTPVVVGDSDSLQVGEFAMAVGNPLGELGGTVTDGIISALDREVTVENQTMNLLQTNAAVSPGNSGGGLFNERGELIGIVNAKSSGQNAEGLGFAIPVNTAIQVAEELINNGYVTGRPAMGVTVLSITDAQTAFQYGVTQAGVYVQSVNAGGAAEKAGLQSGDRFVSIDGTAINSTSDITGIIGKHAVGDTLEVQVVRGTQVITANITLEESTPQASSTQKVEGCRPAGSGKTAACHACACAAVSKTPRPGRAEEKITFPCGPGRGALRYLKSKQ